MSRNRDTKSIVIFFLAIFLTSCSEQPQFEINHFNSSHSSQSKNNTTETSKSEETNKSNETSKSAEKKSIVINNKIEQRNLDVQDNKIFQQHKLLDVPLINQNPELKYGCEVTSLAMVLQYAGIQVDKMELARKLQKDTDPIVRNKSGDIVSWGNPKHGFVGDITGKTRGYAVYVEPVEALMNQYLPHRMVNLSGGSLEDLKKQILNGKPVVVWATGYFKHPAQWDTWKHGTETIDATFDLHALVLVGFDSNSVFVNDPLTGEKAKKVGQQTFIRSWNELGKQALSYR